MTVSTKMIASSFIILPNTLVFNCLLYNNTILVMWINNYHSKSVPGPSLHLKLIPCLIKLRNWFSCIQAQRSAHPSKGKRKPPLVLSPFRRAPTLTLCRPAWPRFTCRMWLTTPATLWQCAERKVPQRRSARSCPALSPSTSATVSYSSSWMVRCIGGTGKAAVQRALAKAQATSFCQPTTQAP